VQDELDRVSVLEHQREHLVVLVVLFVYLVELGVVQDAVRPVGEEVLGEVDHDILRDNLGHGGEVGEAIVGPVEVDHEGVQQQLVQDEVLHALG